MAKSFRQVLKLRFQFPEEHLAGCVLNVWKNILNENFFMQKATYPFIITFGLWAEKDFGITHILLRRVVKNAFYASSGKFREKPFGEKRYTFFIFTKSFEAVLSKLYSNCPEEHFEELFIFEKFILFHHFRTMRRKLLAFCRKLLNSVLKRVFSLSRGKIWEKLFFVLEFASSSSHFQQKLLGVSAKKWGLCCQNRVLNVQRNISREWFLPKKPSFFFYQFQLLSWYFSAFSRKDFSRVVEVTIYVSCISF